MSKKRLVALVAGVSLVLMIVVSLVASCTPTPVETSKPAEAPKAAETSKPITIPYITAAVDASTVLSKGLQHFMNYANANSGGKFNVKFLGGPDVIPRNDQFRAVRDGTVGIALIYGGLYAGDVPIINVIDALKVDKTNSPRWDLATEVGIYAAIDAEMQKVGVKFLGFADSYNPAFVATNREDVKTFGDLKKMKVAAAGYLHTKFVEKIGAGFVNAVGPDVYTGLQQKLVDSASLAPMNAIPYSYYEVVKYVLLPAYKYTGNYTLIMNLKLFNSLAKDQQNLLVAAAGPKLWPFTMTYGVGETQLAMLRVTAMGMQYRELQLTPQEREQFTGIYPTQAREQTQKTLSPEKWAQMEKMLKDYEALLEKKPWMSMAY